MENIHARADGSLLVSVHLAGEIQRWREGQGLDVFAAAGPLTDLAGAPETMLIVLRAESGNEAPAFMTDEPYNRSESCHALRFAQWLHIIAINAPFSVVSAIDKVID